jgi:hypothetical protein
LSGRWGGNGSNLSGGLGRSEVTGVFVSGPSIGDSPSGMFAMYCSMLVAWLDPKLFISLRFILAQTKTPAISANRNKHTITSTLKDVTDVFEVVKR